MPWPIALFLRAILSVANEATWNQTLVPDAPFCDFYSFGADMIKQHTTDKHALYLPSIKSNGVYWFHIVRLSVWTELCPLCIFQNTNRITLTHLINKLQNVCRVLKNCEKSKMWNLAISLNLQLSLLCNMKFKNWFPIGTFIATTFYFPWLYL